MILKVSISIYVFEIFYVFDYNKQLKKSFTVYVFESVVLKHERLTSDFFSNLEPIATSEPSSIDFINSFRCFSLVDKSISR